MVHLVNGANIYRDATQNARIPVKDGISIKEGQLITIENDEITLATANSQVVGIAMKSVVGHANKKCSLPFMQLRDGLEVVIPTNDGSKPKAGGFYTLADHEKIDAGTHSTTPIAHAWNFEFNGRNFVVRSIGF